MNAGLAETPSPICWDQIEEDILCPLCHYNLRGATEPRCAECGYKTTWSQLLDPLERIHPYIFEHHPERNVWSFLQTFRHGLRPPEFWRTLHPGQRASGYRLTLYWGIWTLASFAGLVSLTGAETFIIASAISSIRVPSELADWETLRKLLPMAVDSLSRGGFVHVWVATVCWPWLTAAYLMIFDVVVGRRSLRPVHFLRCAMYSYDLAFLVMFLMTLAFAIIGVTTSTPVWSRDHIKAIGVCALGVTILFVFPARLVLALNAYAGARRTIEVVLTAQGLTILTAMVAAANFGTR